MHARSTQRTGVRLALLTAAGALVAAGLLHDATLFSTARMTDRGTTTAAAVSTGSVSLALSNGASSSSWTGSVSLKPGDTAYKRITVTNDGTSRLRYAVTATSSSALSAKLVMNVAVITPGSPGANTKANDPTSSNAYAMKNTRNQRARSQVATYAANLDERLNTLRTMAEVLDRSGLGD